MQLRQEGLLVFQMLQMRGVVASPSLALARRSPISQGREALWRRCGVWGLVT